MVDQVCGTQIKMKESGSGSFLKKKNQKTFFHLVCATLADDGAPRGNVFWFFFSKKNRFSSRTGL
jgi:hypothetical protein